MRSSNSSSAGLPDSRAPTRRSRSAPAEKLPPAPVMIAARTSSSASIMSQASHSRHSTSALKAFFLPGRLRVMVTTWPSRSTRTAGSDMPSGSSRWAQQAQPPARAGGRRRPPRRGARTAACDRPAAARPRSAPATCSAIARVSELTIIVSRRAEHDHGRDVHGPQRGPQVHRPDGLHALAPDVGRGGDEQGARRLDVGAPRVRAERAPHEEAAQAGPGHGAVDEIAAAGRIRQNRSRPRVARPWAAVATRARPRTRSRTTSG